MIQLPPADPISPITGYGRAHWLAIADQQLAAVRRFASPRGASISLPARPSISGLASDGLEGFARTFLLAAFRVAGEGGADPDGVLDRYRDGLLAGADPASPEAWPRIADRGQPIVESASVVIGLHFTRPWLWDTLDAREQALVCDWLAGATGAETPDNNWVLFRLVVQEFLASAGREPYQPDIDHALQRLERWYLGGGWYRDGGGDNFDYYVGWAMHLYPVIWTFMLERRDPVLARQYRAEFAERLGLFLEDYVYFFGGSGSPVFQGRSLIYRFGAAAPLWLGAWLDANPVDPGAVRRIASGALKFFVDGGAFGPDDTLGLGWLTPFEPMVQHYSGGASPYWASNGFVGLLVPADNPVWTAREQRAPVERRDTVRVLERPGFVLASTSADGIVRLANHGSDHHPTIEPGDDAHYSRLDYSSHTAPAYTAEPLDNHIAVVVDGAASRRMRILRRRPIVHGTLVSAHHPVWGDTESEWTVTTCVALRGPFELRLTLVEPPQGSSTAATAREGGYAVATREDSPLSVVVPLAGYLEHGVEVLEGVSPLAGRVAVPWARGPVSGRSVFASIVVLSADPHDVDAAVRGATTFTLVAAEGTLTARVEVAGAVLAAAL